MERIVRLLTKNLIRRLPTEKENFRLDQLRKLDFPDFIVDRISVEMDQNLDDSIVPPYTEWADMKNRNVQEAWDDFVEAIRSEARLPGTYASSVVESAVSDCMDILIQPRKKIPEIIFGTDKALDRKTLEERSKSIVVYRHLALAPVKYLYRKDMQAITYEQYSHIIETVDEKLVSRYNALNWAQLLEPLFELIGDSIDTNLLRIFFQDKKRPRFARKFDEMNSSISRSGLIEVLSSAELNEEPEKKDHMDALFREESTGKPKKEEEPTGTGLDISRISRMEEEDPQEEDDEVPLHSRFMFDESANYQPETDEKEEPKEESLSFNAMFKDLDHVREKESEEAKQTVESEEIKVESAASENKTEPVKSGSNNIQSVEAAEEANVSENVDEKEEIELVKQFEQGNDSDDNSILSETEPPENEKEETYFWKNFMQDEEEKEVDEEPVDEFEDSEIQAFNEVSEKGSGPKITRAEDLKNWIGDNADRFIKVLFQGSKTAFEEAIEEIAEFNEWKAATRYIEKEIFSRNLINMYDEVAVDFTDQLHSFFMEFKSSKTNS